MKIWAWLAGSAIGMVLGWLLLWLRMRWQVRTIRKTPARSSRRDVIDTPVDGPHEMRSFVVEIDDTVITVRGYAGRRGWRNEMPAGVGRGSTIFFALSDAVRDYWSPNHTTRRQAERRRVTDDVPYCERHKVWHIGTCAEWEKE